MNRVGAGLCPRPPLMWGWVRGEVWLLTLCVVMGDLKVAPTRLARAAVDVGVGFAPVPYGSSPSEEALKKRDRARNVAAAKLAERLGVKRAALVKLRERGYGYLEMIKLALISKRSGTAIEDLARRRDKGEAFTRMAENYHLDLDALHAEAETIRDEVVPLDYLKLAETTTMEIEVPQTGLSVFSTQLITLPPLTTAATSTPLNPAATAPMLLPPTTGR